MLVACKHNVVLMRYRYNSYYVSTTSLMNSSYPSYDVRRYANAVNLTFFVLPGSRCEL